MHCHQKEHRAVRDDTFLTEQLCSPGTRTAWLWQVTAGLHNTAHCTGTTHHGEGCHHAPHT